MSRVLAQMYPTLRPVHMQSGCQVGVLHHHQAVSENSETNPILTPFPPPPDVELRYTSN